MARDPKAAARTKRKERKNIASGVAHVNSSFNNTKILISDVQGNAIAWSSSGTMGFKGSRKSTPYAAQMAAEQAQRSYRTLFDQMPLPALVLDTQGMVDDSNELAFQLPGTRHPLATRIICASSPCLRRLYNFVRLHSRRSIASGPAGYQGGIE